MAHTGTRSLTSDIGSKRAAKTNGAFDAAAPLYERVPWQARPPYELGGEGLITCHDLEPGNATPRASHAVLQVCCGEAAKLTAGHAVQGHQCCRLAPASAASTAGKLRSGTATRGQSADPCSIEPL